ncbi:ribosome biogenesis protein ytm1 [Podospora bellae-mahoneyi]|uniref:Ribosome biogenesis protein ytm1 n=1 Tax=Podospora bellae-mahoneyi TaxID=2093777 RepID=A0ABR0FNI6_9PEZI|nr:ribosome biogenesis protein ytm1 [Podospora bellae-mahoneyi]
MATDTPEPSATQLAQALVEFSLRGSFPEENVSSLPLKPDALAEAIKALADARAKLQAEIHAINEDTADDVRAWQTNAQSVQDDMIRSKALANEIIKTSEAPAVSGKDTHDAEAKAEFLVRELNYNAQVQEALKGIRTVNRTLDEVEKARDERRILDALHLLERSWKELDAIPVNKSCRAIKLLDIRAFELKSDVHEVFDHVWNTLINVDVEKHTVSMSSGRDDEPMSLSDAVIGLQAYKEVDRRTAQLWASLNAAVLVPRMDMERETLPGIQIQDNTLEVKGTTDKSVESLFTDLEKVFRFLVERLPGDLVETISPTLLPGVIHRVTSVWLDSAVPSSLNDMARFQQVIALAKSFCATLRKLGFTNLGDLQEWTESAPRVWLSKCREAALDAVRTKLSKGFGEPTRVEKIEKQMVSKSEGQKIAANGAAAVDDDGEGWGDAWGIGDDEPPKEEPKEVEKKAAAKPADDGEEDVADAWGWGDEAAEEEQLIEETRKKTEMEDEDPADAWGWGDDTNNDAPTATATATKSEPEIRELVLKETYSISSMPQPVLDLIAAIVEDGAALTQDRHASSPVAAAAAGLFGVPTLALALFRAISPHYYAPKEGGNMFLYNDATWLSEKLADFSATWKTRHDISTRAQNMLRLDNDVKALQGFANRAYTNELSLKKMMLRDRLGGEQNLLQLDDTESYVASAVSMVRSIALEWEPILAKSVWQQAVGSMVDALASKIVSDVMDLPSIGQEEAYNIAKHIASVEELDDLFLPRNGEVPLTAQFAGSWLRLKYLSEVLQSNLRDVRYLWMEGELSLYFGVEEVLDLIGASFEENARTREVVKEIRGNPRPRGE